MGVLPKKGLHYKTSRKIGNFATPFATQNDQGANGDGTVKPITNEPSALISSAEKYREE